MSKFLASVYDYVNSCEIAQLDAIIVALFFLITGCGLIVSIFIASWIAGAGQTEPRVMSRIVVPATGTTGGQIFIPVDAPLASHTFNQSYRTFNQASQPFNQPYPVFNQPIYQPQYQAQSALAPTTSGTGSYSAGLPLRPDQTCPIAELPSSAGSDRYGRPRQLYGYPQYGQAAAANRPFR